MHHSSFLMSKMKLGIRWSTHADWLISSFIFFYIRSFAQHFTLFRKRAPELTFWMRDSLCRMATESSSQAEQSTQVSELGASSSVTFPAHEPIVDPPERIKSTVSVRFLKQMCAQFGIAEEDTLLPNATQYADTPSEGYVAVNRQMCLHGAIPPFCPYLEVILRRLAIAPFQLHPNGYAILLGLGVLFMQKCQRLPTFDEICSLCLLNFSNKKNSSIVYAKAVRNRALITKLPESASGFLNQYFYVKCSDSFYRTWGKGGRSTSQFYSKYSKTLIFLIS